MDLTRLREWVEINSGSDHMEGLARMADALESTLKGLEGTLERIPVPPRHGTDGQTVPAGDLLRFRFRENAPLQVLLSGHMDTVFAPTHPFQHWRDLGDGRANGPGVADMKGGLFILIEAVREFLAADTTGALGGEILITADEEVGSSSSLAWIQEAARRNHIGLVFESALPGGELVSARMGTGTFHVRAHGKAAHTGRDFENGRNAVAAVADFSLACHRINGRVPRAIVNVGRITGGGPVNVVPDFAEAWFNLRTGHPDTQLELEAELARIRAEVEGRHPGIRLELQGGFTRAPAVETAGNNWLHDLWNRCESELGLKPSGKRSTGGSSDGNILAEMGMPYLDGVGIRGGAIHSSDEYAILESVPEQIAKCVRFLHALAAQPDCIRVEPLHKVLP